MKNRTGEKYGRLTAIKIDHKDKSNRYHWLCECECGNYTVVAGDALTKGLTRSCGCLLDEQRHKKGVEANRTKHGMCGTRIHRIWKVMKNRCYNKNTEDYQKWYGSRGITVCDEWKNDFMSFYKWSMDNGYRDDLTIDRVNANGNYEPSNCRWVDWKTQANNKRTSKKIT